MAALFLVLTSANRATSGANCRCSFWVKIPDVRKRRRKKEKRERGSIYTELCLQPMHLIRPALGVQTGDQTRRLQVSTPQQVSR